jgi:hypothetical protein
VTEKKTNLAVGIIGVSIDVTAINLPERIKAILASSFTSTVLTSVKK